MFNMIFADCKHCSVRSGLIILVAVVLACGSALNSYADETEPPIRDAGPLPPNERGKDFTPGTDLSPGGPNGPAPRLADDELARASLEGVGPYRTDANSRATLAKRLAAEANAEHKGGPYGPPSAAERLENAPRSGGPYDDPYSPDNAESEKTDAPEE